VVSLHVAGSDRHWVNDATEAVAQAIQSGVPQSERFFQRMTLASVVIGAIGMAIAIIGDAAESGRLAASGVVLLLTGGGLLILSVLPGSVLPRPEILPEGKQTRRSKVLRCARREVGWWVRNVLLIVVGIVLGLLADNLID
jgi:hypothetical protein